MNQLFMIYQEKRVRTIPDNRYRIMVSLVRSDRPLHQNFNCINCGSKVVEIVNREIIAMEDFFDIESTRRSGVTRHCKGEDSQTGRACPFSYFFNFE